MKIIKTKINVETEEILENSSGKFWRKEIKHIEDDGVQTFRAVYWKKIVARNSHYEDHVTLNKKERRDVEDSYRMVFNENNNVKHKEEV